jgi:phosphopantetheine adenylyltransferase
MLCFLCQISDHTRQLLDELQVLFLADQHRWLLLHSSLHRQVVHLPRGNQWEQEVRNEGRVG